MSCSTGIAASAYGSCAGNGNTSNCSRTITTPSGTVVTLTQVKSNGTQSGQYGYAMTVTSRT